MRKPKIPTLSGGQIENLLGPGTSYRGTLISDENIRIDGTYEGRIETAGNVIIGPSAKVLADIVANTIQVWGTVRGSITARSPLEILPNGRVWGDVSVASLLIDEGGTFRGECVMGEGDQAIEVREDGLQGTDSRVVTDLLTQRGKGDATSGEAGEAS